MNLSPSYSYEEWKANQMWQSYETKNQQQFWNDYERLIRRNIPYKLTKKPSRVKKVSAPKPLLKKRVFERSTEAHLLNSLLVFATFLFGSAIAIYSIYSNGISNAATIFTCTLSLVVCIASISSFNNFEADQHFFYISKPFCLKKIRLEWEIIESIAIAKDYRGDNVTSSIMINTRFRDYYFNYGLSDEIHEWLMEVLLQKVPNTTFKK